MEHRVCVDFGDAQCSITHESSHYLAYELYSGFLREKTRYGIPGSREQRGRCLGFARNQTATPTGLRKPTPAPAPARGATPLGLWFIGRRRQGRLASSPTLPFAVRTPLAFTAPVRAPLAFTALARAPLAFATPARAGIERQRRSTTKPRVGARHERLPWVAITPPTQPTPTGLHSKAQGWFTPTNLPSHNVCKFALSRQRVLSRFHSKKDALWDTRR
jgi:hypothetical protein